MSNPTNSFPDRAAFAERISAAYARSFDAILDVGRELIAAKDALPHGEWTRMIKRDLPFGERQAQRLMSIARHPVLANPTHGAFFTGQSVRALYELSRLEPEVLHRVVKNPRRHMIEGELHVASILIVSDLSKAMAPRVTVQGVAAQVEEIAATSHAHNPDDHDVDVDQPIAEAPIAQEGELLVTPGQQPPPAMHEEAVTLEGEFRVEATPVEVDLVDVCVRVPRGCEADVERLAAELRGGLH